ncbi:MAG TPA: hypothetical protein VHK27_00960, partial [Gammaproteobacteria bacterium]|nr:hypothetical protein [Gammaproteobacteria bacterium]
LPATLTKFAPAGSADDITFQVGTTDVQIFDPYPGHKVTIVAFAPIPNTTPQRFESIVVGEARITTSGVLSTPISTGRNLLTFRYGITLVLPGNSENLPLKR